MDILQLIKILKNNFLKKYFFVRVYHISPDIIIYNDIDIILKYNIDMFNNIDRMVKKIMNDVRIKIENKYSIPNDMVSVIIPNYNNDIFLKTVISKILENTYNNIEIIIVDDKSTDNSINIIKQFSNNKIKLYQNNENNGTYYCRNKGILMSKGDYILNIDGDDYIDSTYIENMVGRLKNYGNNIWGYGRKFERVYLDKNLNIIHKKKIPFHNVLFKRKLFNYLGFFHNSRYGADVEFIFRAKIYKYPIKFEYNNDNIQYHANTLKNKNLTQVVDSKKRSEYIASAKKNVSMHNYIQMALLD
jgi:glycosyltransferase involved in cell wall biosynthesis